MQISEVNVNWKCYHKDDVKVFKYTELSEESKKVARDELIVDAESFFDQPDMTDEEAHEDLMKHDDENFFDDEGILVSNGGCYAG
jgi:hypothetical protein